LLVARDGPRLKAAADAIQGPVPVATVTADITRQADVERFGQSVHGLLGRVDLLVNAAGRSTRGYVSQATVEEFEALWQLNFLGTVRVTRAMLPLLCESRGSIINIGSLASKAAIPQLGAYPASKSALAAYSQQLRQELRPAGVHVMLVCPGPVARADAGSRYDEVAGGLPDSVRGPAGGVRLSGIDPRLLAVKILQACRRKRPELVLPGRARLLFALAQLSPSLGDWILRRLQRDH
jgi:short-subunit dehydrogenase